MLRIKVNNSDFKSGTEIFNPNEIRLVDDKLRITYYEHGKWIGSTVEFYRITTTADLYADKSVLTATNDYVEIEPFNDIQVIPSSVNIENIATGFDEEGVLVYRRGLVFYFEETPHEFLSNLDFGYITDVIDEGYYGYPDPVPSKKCIGDHVLFNGFLYEIGEDGVNEYNKYVFSNNPYDSLNSQWVDFWFVNEALNNRVVHIDKGIVPILSDGTEDRTRVIFFFDEGDDERANNLNEAASKCLYIDIYSQDRRFLLPNEGTDTYSFIFDSSNTQVSFVQKFVGTLNLDVAFDSDYNVGLLQDDVLANQYAEEVKKRNINPIIDFERKMFTPVRYNESNFDNIADDYFTNISEVEFNLHFRQRTNDGVDEGKAPWRTDDTLGWNNYWLSEHNNNFVLSPKRDDMKVTDADLLVFLGYTDGDVYFQRNILKKSFIRLSFYDTTDRRTQNLLFYSTMFYDTGEAFTKYTKARAFSTDDGYYGITDNESTFVANEYTNDEENKQFRICARFSARDNLDMQHSSEGFYTYFYPSLVSGTVPNVVYMKVEFNHAKYGRVVPFVMPSEDGGDGKINVIEPTDSKFPIHYMMMDEHDEYSKVNWDKLNKDMYIKVYIKYDDLHHQYVWYLARNKEEYETDNKMVLNLFEPRVNGYETLAEDTEPDTPPYEPPVEPPTPPTPPIPPIPPIPPTPTPSGDTGTTGVIIEVTASYVESTEVPVTVYFPVSFAVNVDGTLRLKTNFSIETSGMKFESEPITFGNNEPKFTFNFRNSTPGPQADGLDFGIAYSVDLKYSKDGNSIPIFENEVLLADDLFKHYREFNSADVGGLGAMVNDENKIVLQITITPKYVDYTQDNFNGLFQE